ncbi:MAG: GNAT family N-acetyltransferase [Aquihabitans sp.]
MDGTLSLLPEYIDGPRVTLRRWRVEDAPALAVSVERNFEHLRPWMPWVADEPLDPSERLALVQGWEQRWRGGGDAILGVFAAGRIIGGSGLHRRRGPAGLEIGYWIDKDHVRQGFGTEIGRLLTTAALAAAAVTFVEIHHDKANVASAGIPKRLGYAFVGEAPDAITAPGEVGIDCAWRMDAAEWDLLGASGCSARRTT